MLWVPCKECFNLHRDRHIQLCMEIDRKLYFERSQRKAQLSLNDFYLSLSIKEKRNNMLINQKLIKG